MQPVKLFNPLQVGKHSLPNRVFMAPLTRLRSIEPGDLPVPLMAEYYAQRASAGLIVSEATQISPQGKGYAGAPGIYSTQQVAAWKPITDAVHANGGRIALQLRHVGRISHRSLLDGEAPVAPSAVRADSNATVRDAHGNLARVPTDTPRALELAELPLIVRDYADAAESAMAAGFDFVEIHGAHGYLLEQFLATDSNQRDDAYGGSVENRARLLLEVVDAVVAKIGAERTGIRISPHGIFNGINGNGSDDMAFYLAEQLNLRGLAFLHLSEPDWAGGPQLSDAFRQGLRQRFNGPIIGAGGYTAEKAERLINAGLIDAAAFGRPYIANPDLVERLRRGAILNAPDAATFYGGGAEGYTDYPTLETAAA